MVDSPGLEVEIVRLRTNLFEQLPHLFNDGMFEEMMGSPEAVIRCANEFLEGYSPIHADWSQAPAWANWWAVDPDGICHWFDNEPILTEFVSHRNEIAPHWSHHGSKQSTYDAINIPRGTDWRMLKECREAAPMGQGRTP